MSEQQQHSFLRKTWVGICGGLGGALIGGKAAYVVVLVNCANPSLTVPCVVHADRLGLVAHVGTGITIAFVTGMSSHAQLGNNLKSGGFDFAIDLAGKWGELLKAAGRASRGARMLSNVNDLKSLKAFLHTEPGKLFINAMTGDLSVSAKNTPTFAMIGSPVGVGVGAGVWYEWQVVAPFDSPEAWAYAPITWRLKRHAGSLWVQAKGIPASDGTELTVIGKRFGWGLDGVINFGAPNNQRNSRPRAIGVVEGGMLVESPKTIGVGSRPEEGGLNLSKRSFSSSRNPLTSSINSFGRNEVISMGLGFCDSTGSIWQSSQSKRVFLEVTPAIISMSGKPTAQLQQKSPSANWLL